MVKDHHGNQQCRASRWRAKIRKLGSGKGCFSSLAASSAEELDPQHRVSTDVQRIPESLPAPQCPGPSVTRHTNTVPCAGLLRIPGSWEVLCLLCTGGTAWKWGGVCSEIRVIVHMTEKRYQGSSPLQGNYSLQLFLGCSLPWPLLSRDCLVSLGGNWDFPNQPVKVETMNNSVTKHLCKEEQASTCREEPCM